MNYLPDDGLPVELNILLVDLSKKFGGASVRTLTLAEHLKPWNVLVAGIKGGAVVEEAKRQKLEVRIVGSGRLDPWIPFRLLKIIVKEKVQVVDTQNIQSKFWVSVVALMCRFTFVSTLNSSYASENFDSRKGAFYAYLDQLTNQNVKRYVAVSNSIRAELIRKSIPAEKIDLIKNAVVSNNLESLVVNNRQILQEFGIPDNVFLFIAVGRLVWAKGYEDLIDAFATVANKLENIQLVILGDGELREALTNRIVQHGLVGRIRLLGHLNKEKVHALLKIGNAYVMTSRSEGIPYALLEAGSYGLPILATKCGGIPEVLTHNVDAILVEVGDIPAIASGMRALCEDKQSSVLGRNVKLKIASEYSVDAQINLVRNTYLRAVDPLGIKIAT